MNLFVSNNYLCRIHEYAKLRAANHAGRFKL